MEASHTGVDRGGRRYLGVRDVSIHVISLQRCSRVKEIAPCPALTVVGFGRVIKSQTVKYVGTVEHYIEALRIRDRIQLVFVPVRLIG